jgi:hypothetical protein
VKLEFGAVFMRTARYVCAVVGVTLASCTSLEENSPGAQASAQCMAEVLRASIPAKITSVANVMTQNGPRIRIEYEHGEPPRDHRIFLGTEPDPAGFYAYAYTNDPALSDQLERVLAVQCQAKAFLYLP